MPNVSASTPWMSFARKLYMLFGQDPDIQLVYNDVDVPEIKLYVNNAIKADALGKKLPTSVEFGNVSLKITVLPSNTEESDIDIFRNIFTGNPIFKEIIVGETTPLSPGFNFVVLENKTAQFFDDQLNDPNGLESTLYEDIAREIFMDEKGVFFSTETSDDVVIWP